MKKILLTVVALATFGLSQAQDIKFGAKAGLNISTITGDLEDAKSLVGAHFGGFAEIKISDKFAFQPELLYSMQGAKSEYSESDTDYSYSEESKYKLGYLNIPLMVKYFATDKLFIEAGPQVGFLLSAKQDYSYSETYMGITDSASIDGIDVKDNFETIDFGLNFGFGYEFTENIFAGARYNVGLSNIAKDSGDSKVHNGVFQISVGYKF